MANRTRSDSRCGAAFVEFSLVFLMVLTLLVGMFEFTWTLFMHATFHHATREAVREAITGNSSIPGEFDNSVKASIQKNTIGLISGAALDQHVDVELFAANCAGQTCPIADVRPGSIIKVTIRCFPVTPITSLIRHRDSQTGEIVPFTLSISSSDKMEPFPGNAPARGPLANPTAYDAGTGLCN